MYHEVKYPRHKRFDFTSAFDRMYAADGPYWAARANGALDALRSSGMPDDVYYAVVEAQDAVCGEMTWRELFYARRLALLTWRIDPRADLLAECGLVVGAPVACDLIASAIS